MERKRLLLSFFFSLICLVSFGQTSQITGKVTSASDGSGLPGVSVTVKGTTTGSITDETGSFSINASNKDLLVFSFVGYLPQEVLVGNKKIINVILSDNDTFLNELVVVGYGEQSKKLSTQSISTVTSKSIKDRPVLSPQELLQGQAAGVQMVNSSGQLGANSSIRIRGAASITGGGQPLFVVDGVPLNDGSLSANQGGGTSINPLININTNDIESMSVLKDAAAVSIYGSRGANGVIIITTKKGGKDKKTEINLDTYTGFSSPTGLIGMMNTDQFYQQVNASRTARGLAAVTPNTDYFDWPDAVVQQGRTNNLSLSARGGSANTTFYVSGTYGKESGFTIGNDLNRLSGRLNLEHKANDFLSIGTNISLSNVNLDRIGVENNTFAPLTSAYLQLPYVLPRDANGNLLNTGFIQNVLAIEELNTNLYKAGRLTGNVFANFKLAKDLVFRTDFGMDKNTGDSKARSVDLLAPSGSGSRDLQIDNKWLSTNTLKYFKEFGKSTIDVLAGYSYETSQFDRIAVGGSGYASDGLPNVSSAATPTSTIEERSQWALQSQFLRLNYSLSNKYLLEGTIRRDGSSRFGVNNRYGIFYAMSGGWLVSEESFMKNQDFINFMKLTVSYGTAGNDRIGNFSSLPLYGGGTTADYLGLPGLRPTQTPNPNLTWEETAQLDLGIQTTFFKNIFTLNLNYYDKITSGLLLDVPFPFTTGFASASQNVGRMQNKGVDIDFSANIINKKDLNWTVGLNAGYVKNTVLELPNASVDPDGNRFVAGSAAQRAVEGRSLNEFYMVRANGVNPETGNFEWLDKDGNPTTTYSANNRVFVGSAIPKWVGGLNSNVSYKGVDLGFLFNFSYGNKILIDGLRFTDNVNSAGFNKSIDLLDYWKAPGDQTFVPNLASPTAGLFNQASTLQLQNGSFLRLRNVSLGYTIPSSILKGQKIFRSARIYGMGQNLFLVKDKNFRGPDPEVSANGPNNVIQGESFFALPQAKTFTFGLNLGF
ncbi:SusC/RagA family TonB-linked outer membrane protein [Lacihabitans lacunae]|jgi:TonB-dependent starch-binding outer membrane protein SusC|uniref:SusC/RagA family TonB-linked outer membrane protein n=1 Tax=Lacihabitans lacunae TaxID=1028214 RepID=A0ABV7Z1Q6_9BACT